MAFQPCAKITDGLNGLSCDTNPGGVQEIYLTNFEDFSYTLTGGTVSSITDPLTLGTASFFTYTFRRNTASVQEELTKDLTTGSLFYTQTSTIVLDRWEKVKRDQLMLLDKAVIGYIVKKTNGTYWLFGADDGAFVTTNVATSGTAKADQNGYTITIVSEEPQRAYPIDPAIIPALIAI
jgi:hypothetical protein